MSFDSNDLLRDFQFEGHQCLEECERAILKMERAETFESGYKEASLLFRSIKGLSGMFGIKEVVQIFHHFEGLMSRYQERSFFPAELVDYFYAGVDVADKHIVGKKVDFELYDPVERTAGQDNFEGSSDLLNVGADLEGQGAREDFVRSSKGKGRDLSTSKTAGKAPTTGTDGSIYLVDDEQDLLDGMKDTIENFSLDLAIHTFTSAEAALKQFDKTPLHEQPMMIISDLKLPGLSGLGLLGEMGSRNNNIPFALLSGRLEDADYRVALEHGAYAILSKPVKPVELEFHIYSAMKYKESLDLVRKSLKFMFYMFESTKGLPTNERKLLESEIQWIMHRVDGLKSYGKVA
ncbi:MAG: response regulator [Bdellovibrionales bacterium]|nr:response regulator [Bdellovibrionales bacterium]